MNSHGTLKIIVCGPPMVGKTYFLNKLCDRNYNNYKPTIGVDMYCKLLKTKFLGLDISWKVYLWDTSGNNNFMGITKEFYKTCAICVILYTNQEDIEKYKKVGLENNPNLYFVEVHRDVYNTKTILPNIIESYSTYLEKNKIPLNRLNGLKIENRQLIKNKQRVCDNIFDINNCNLI